MPEMGHHHQLSNNGIHGLEHSETDICLIIGSLIMRLQSFSARIERLKLSKEEKDTIKSIEYLA